MNDFFEVSRETDLFTVDGLTKFIGLGPEDWLKVAVKELVDNALDAAEGAGIRPFILVDLQSRDDRFALEVADNGPGIPPEVIRSIFDSRTRTSSKVGFIAPSRGRQGNALPSILGMMGALWPPGQAPALEIASRGVLHRITALVDATGAAQIECESGSSEVTGTVVRVELSTSTPFESPNELVEAYTVFNPHLRLQFCGAVHLPTSDRFKNWQPDSPTPPHWYSKTDFRKLVGYARDRDPGTLLRDFVRRFKGLSSTQKAAAVCKVTQATTLEELAESAPGINKVLMEMKVKANGCARRS